MNNLTISTYSGRVIYLSLKSIVVTLACVVSYESPSVNFRNRVDFPTAESPTSIILYLS